MARTITVKGIGKASAKPDYVVLSMTLESKHKDYDKAMDMVAYHWRELDIYSHTRYDCCENAMPLMAKSIDIDPDDIDVSDTATFVWEIK